MAERQEDPCRRTIIVRPGCRPTATAAAATDLMLTALMGIRPDVPARTTQSRCAPSGALRWLHSA